MDKVRCERCGFRFDASKTYTCETCGRSICEACLKLIDKTPTCLTCYRDDEMRQIAQAVAEGTLVRHPTRPTYSCAHCAATVDISRVNGPALPWAQGHIQHTSSCLVTRAREVLKIM